MFKRQMSNRLARGFFSLEGNIGAGKSTFLKFLSRTRLAQKLELVQQPVQVWKQIGPNKTNLLDLYYKEPLRWGLPFQLTVLFSRMQRLKRCKGEKSVLMERSIDADFYVFGKLMNQNITKQQSDIYYHIYQFIKEQTHLSHQGFIYFRVSELQCLSRIKTRARPEETQINLNYLTRIKDLHEDWLQGKRVFVVQNFEPQGDNAQLLNQLEKFMYLI